jgi:hypothetical protein
MILIAIKLCQSSNWDMLQPIRTPQTTGVPAPSCGGRIGWGSRGIVQSTALCRVTRYAPSWIFPCKGEEMRRGGYSNGIDSDQIQ